MIPQRFIKRYLNRRLYDYRRWKQLSASELEGYQRQLPIKPPYWDKLYKDQRVCVIIGAKQPRFAIFSDPSCGKTFISLSLAKYFWLLKRFDRVLVLVPRRSNKSEWALEIEKHTQDIDCLVLRGTSENKWQQLRDSEALITVETYAGLTRLVSKTHNGKLVPDADAIAELAATFGGFVFDESSLLGGGAAEVNEESLIFLICDALTRNAFMVLELSGTPFGRDPSLIWAQMYIVDRGETLGRTLGLFKAAFFGAKDYWGRQEFLPSKEKVLHRLLANRSLRFEVSESDLPRKRPLRKYVLMPAEQREWFDRMLDILRTDPDRNKKWNAFLRMRQVSSGFVGVIDDEDGERAEVEFTENPKLEALVAFVESIPRQYHFIIFHEFIWSGKQIERALTDLGLSFMSLRGSTEDPDVVLRAFRSKSKQGLVINHKSGDFGLNLQTACYTIYYESPVSAIGRKQTEFRVRRRFSEHEWVVIMDMLMRGTMDDRILDFHNEAEDLFQSILNGRVRI